MGQIRERRTHIYRKESEIVIRRKDVKRDEKERIERMSQFRQKISNKGKYAILSSYQNDIRKILQLNRLQQN